LSSDEENISYNEHETILVTAHNSEDQANPNLSQLIKQLSDQSYQNQNLLDQNQLLVTECQKKAAVLQYTQHCIGISANLSEKLLVVTEEQLEKIQK
jgi:hypothetical protein